MEVCEGCNAKSPDENNAGFTVCCNCEIAIYNDSDICYSCQGRGCDECDMIGYVSDPVIKDPREGEEHEYDEGHGDR